MPTRPVSGSKEETVMGTANSPQLENPTQANRLIATGARWEGEVRRHRVCPMGTRDCAPRGARIAGPRPGGFVTVPAVARGHPRSGTSPVWRRRWPRPRTRPARSAAVLSATVVASGGSSRATPAAPRHSTVNSGRPTCFLPRRRVCRSRRPIAAAAMNGIFCQKPACPAADVYSLARAIDGQRQTRR